MFGIKIKRPVVVLPCECRYDLSAIKRIDNGFYLLTSKGNISRAVEDTLNMNPFIEKAGKLLRSFPINHISEKQLRFTKSNDTIRDYCVISFNEQTKTGQVAKWPVCLHFHPNDLVFGSIFYGQNGKIGRAEIISKRKMQNLYTLLLALIGGELDISAIYEADTTAVKRKMYYRKPS